MLMCLEGCNMVCNRECCSKLSKTFFCSCDKHARFKRIKDFAVRLRIFLIDVRGSATIEFVALVIPLFVPLGIYIATLAHATLGHLDIQNLAGQMAKAYVASQNDDAARANLDSLNQEYSARVLQKEGIATLPTYQVQCQSNPCISKNSAVVITVNLVTSAGAISASAAQIVDAWR